MTSYPPTELENDQTLFPDRVLGPSCLVSIPKPIQLDCPSSPSSIIQGDVDGSHTLSCSTVFHSRSPVTVCVHSCIGPSPTVVRLFIPKVAAFLLPSSPAA
ncbi:hypothetical protein BDV23DRAFT_86846 [Aspergillus alliaceus]|uniref:Uncharacterized protein n=1 Tax=Petromyces alliaceus TaxID=209559 RepID=A0A5N7C8X4_PETAA|nr:hypothetical protein BDV23DRAFT_86846 [Aspergillus alliaceus]